MRKDLIIPIYDCKATIVVEGDFESAVDEAGYKYDLKGATGVCLHYPDHPSNFTILFREGCVSPGAIAHEAFHLTCKIMDVVDIHYDSNEQEPFAYLIGFIVDGIHQMLDTE